MVDSCNRSRNSPTALATQRIQAPRYCFPFFSVIQAAMDAAEDTARARAEARRQKILARQKDRLSSIIGTYSKQEEPSGGCDVGSPAVPAAPAPPRATTAAAPDAGRMQAPSSTAQQQDQQPPTVQQLQAMMAEMGAQILERQWPHAMRTGPPLNPQTVELLQRSAQQAASRGQSQGGASNASSTTAAEALQSLLGSAAAAAAAADSGGAAATAAGDPGALLQQEQQSTQQQQQQQQQVPMLLQLGPALARSVKQTQLFRLLAALLVAYAALVGWLQTGLRPVALLVLTDVAVVLAGAAVLPAGKQDAAADGAAAQQVPWRLRSLDVVSLVPGLRQLLDSLAGYHALATAVSQDFAAFVVVCGLALSTNAVPAAVEWGLRY